MQYIKEVMSAVREAETCGRKVKIEGLSGFSGDKIIGMMQRCVCIDSLASTCYVEVGVFQGLSLTSVAAASAIPCYGIDNFSQFDVNGENRAIAERRIKAFAAGRAQIIDADFEDALMALSRFIGEQKVGLYFVDGPHDYRSQYLCLAFVKPFLAERSVIIVDDSNYEHVRRANGDWLKANPEFALVYEAYTTAHPSNMSEAMARDARAGWWNGVNAIVRDPDRALVRTYPPVDASRERYFNDHEIHFSRHSELAPRLLATLGYRSPKRLAGLLRAWWQSDKFRSRYPGLNTYSSALSGGRFAEWSLQQAEGNGG